MTRKQAKKKVTKNIINRKHTRRKNPVKRARISKKNVEKNKKKVIENNLYRKYPNEPYRKSSTNQITQAQERHRDDNSKQKKSY